MALWNPANDDPFLYDRRGQRVFAGDYVQCAVGDYASLDKGERRRVQEIKDGCFVLNNSLSPIATSLYRPTNFYLAARHHVWHSLPRSMPPTYQIPGFTGPITKEIAKVATSPVMFIAVEIGETSYEAIAKEIEEQTLPPRSMLADTSYQRLQAAVKRRILSNPAEKWLILSGTTLAEVSAPPVVFRTA